MTATDRTRRLAAAVAAALAATAAAGLSAPPAFAQGPAPSNVLVILDEPVVPGHVPLDGSFEIYYDEPPADGDLTARIDIDAPDGTLYFESGLGCTPDTGAAVDCAQSDPDDFTLFGFTLGASLGTPLGEYEYTVTVAIDGAEVYSDTGTVEVADSRPDAGVFRDFVHENLVFTGVEAGAVVDADPRILQNSAYPDDMVALAVYFGAPAAPGVGIDGAVPQVPWDNCMPDIFIPTGGYFCFFTDFEDLPGTVLEFSEPVRYQVDTDVPGPLVVCECGYDLWGMDAEVLARDFGEPWWDPDSSNLLSIIEAADQQAPEPDEDPVRGSITIETTANAYDLSVEGADLRGTEVQATVPVANGGPAAAPNRALSEEQSGYQLRGQLPEDAELVSLDSDGEEQWNCVDSGDLADLYEAAGGDTELDRFDFVCTFWRLEPGETLDFTFTVNLADATGDPGRIEVDALYRGVDGVNLDGDLSNNSAALTVDGRSLPNTGSSTIVFVAVAAGALVLGIVLFVVARRRKSPADPA